MGGLLSAAFGAWVSFSGIQDFYWATGAGVVCGLVLVAIVWRKWGPQLNAWHYLFIGLLGTTVFSTIAFVAAITLYRGKAFLAANGETTQVVPSPPKSSPAALEIAFGDGPNFVLRGFVTTKKAVTASVVGRYASDVHTLSDVRWRWSEPKRLMEPKVLLPGEAHRMVLVSTEYHSEKPPTILGDTITIDERSSSVIRLELTLIVEGEQVATETRGISIKNVRGEYVYDMVDSSTLSKLAH